jgi:hypothetical protein
MHNEEHAVGAEQVSQDQVEAILKLANTGSSPDAISSFFGLNIQMVQRVIANDPLHRGKVVQSIKERSADYRCALSNRLMISPAMARDENYYEQRILEADSSLSLNPFIPSPKLKAKIADFCKESLKELEGDLRQKHPQEDILELTSECLSVLCNEAGLETVLRVLGLVEGATVRKLAEKLWSLVPESLLFGLINQLAQELPSHALCLAALIILEPRSERALEEAFRCFAGLLSQATVGPEAIDLAEEVSDRLSSSQLSQLNSALEACPREGGDKLDGLRLKEAYALLREGRVEAANCIVSTLRMSSSLENEVQRFYDEASLSIGKVPILEQRLSAKLVEISRDSPSLAEALSILHQLLTAELHFHTSEAKSQSLISLKTEVLNETLANLGQQTSNALIAQDSRIQRLEEQAQRKIVDCQETLASHREVVGALIDGLVKAEQAASQTQTALVTTQRSIEEKSQKAEAATQQTISSLRGVVETLRIDLDQTWSQCKQAQLAQEAIIQRLQAQSDKTQANALKRDLVEISLLDTKEALYHLHEVPTFIYSYKPDTDQLHRTNLVTGENSSHRVPSYTFKGGCCWSEVPGGSLLITGGGYPTAVRDVVRIDAGTFEVSRLPHMLTPRAGHAAVYHTPHLYILGGDDDSYLSECERYVCAENRWEALPPLPRACSGTSGVVVESSLYALGGYDRSALDLVQKLSLESLTWELMQLRLPFVGCGIPCFKLSDTEVYLVVNKTLCSFSAFEVRPLKTLTKDIESWFGASYYRRGTLYCSSYAGGVLSLEIA